MNEKKCPHCDGTGELLPEDACRPCRGLGRVVKVSCIDIGFALYDACPECDGTGKRAVEAAGVNQ